MKKVIFDTNSSGFSFQMRFRDQKEVKHFNHDIHFYSGYIVNGYPDHCTDNMYCIECYRCFPDSGMLYPVFFHKMELDNLTTDTTSYDLTFIEAVSSYVLEMLFGSESE